MQRSQYKGGDHRVVGILTNPHPLVEAVVDRLLLGLLTFFKGTNAWLEHVRSRSVIWKSERGVGPTKGVEDSP